MILIEFDYDERRSFMKSFNTKMLCMLEIESSITPKRQLNMCQGLPSDDESSENAYCNECQKCRNFFYNRIMKKVLNFLCTVIAVFGFLIFTTAQGAIRGNLLFTNGVDAALSASVLKKESIKQGIFQTDVYIVYIDGTEETWIVEYRGSNCYATKID